jgi:ASC-1-like (ASCH) protein
MKLNPGPFEKITNGNKVIEIRLNDEKRKLLKIGDEIEFQIMNDETKKILTKIIDLSVFPSFKEMFSAFPPQEYGSLSQDEYTKMYDIYLPEKEKEFGVLAIRIQFISHVK